MTGTYHFETGFYGHTDMPAEFQKAIDCSLAGLNVTFCFLDDILIVSRWSEKKPHELKSFSNEIVETLGTLKAPVSWND